MMKYAVVTLLLLAAPTFAADPVYSWVKRMDEPDRIYLYRDGKQIGGWDYQAKHYRSLEGDTWGAPMSAAPVTPPAHVKQIPVEHRTAQWNITPVQRRGILPRGRVTESIVDAMAQQMAVAIGEAMAQAFTDAVKELTLEMLKQLKKK